MKFRRSGKSSNINSDDPDNPNNLEVSNKEIPTKNEDANRDEFKPMALGNGPRSTSRNSFVMRSVSVMRLVFHQVRNDRLFEVSTN